MAIPKVAELSGRVATLQRAVQVAVQCFNFVWHPPFLFKKVVVLLLQLMDAQIEFNGCNTSNVGESDLRVCCCCIKTETSPIRCCGGA